MTENDKFKSSWCGLTGYSVGLELQESAAEQVQKSDSCAAVLLGLEHEPVITLGRKANGQDLICPSDDFQVVRTTRGGRATLHEPGQLVIYPIASLERLGVGVRDFVQGSLQALLLAVEELGLEARMDMDDPGIYTATGKIGFVGVHVSHGITRHGLSLNVLNPVDRFRSIRPCGHEVQAMDSLQLHGLDATPKDAFEVFSHAWIKQFGLTSSSRAANFVSPRMVCWRSW